MTESLSQAGLVTQPKASVLKPLLESEDETVVHIINNSTEDDVIASIHMVALRGDMSVTFASEIVLDDDAKALLSAAEHRERFIASLSKSYSVTALDVITDNQSELFGKYRYIVESDSSSTELTITPFMGRNSIDPILSLKTIAPFDKSPVKTASIMESRYNDHFNMTRSLQELLYWESGRQFITKINTQELRRSEGVSVKDIAGELMVIAGDQFSQLSAEQLYELHKKIPRWQVALDSSDGAQRLSRLEEYYIRQLTMGLLKRSDDLAPEGNIGFAASKADLIEQDDSEVIQQKIRVIEHMKDMKKLDELLLTEASWKVFLQDSNQNENTFSTSTFVENVFFQLIEQHYTGKKPVFDAFIRIYYELLRHNYPTILKGEEQKIESMNIPKDHFSFVEDGDSNIIHDEIESRMSKETQALDLVQTTKNVLAWAMYKRKLHDQKADDKNIYERYTHLARMLYAFTRFNDTMRDYETVVSAINDTW